MRFVTTLTVALVLALLAVAPAPADTLSLETSADAWGYSGYSNASYNGDKNYGAGTDAYGAVMMAGWRYSNGTGNQKFWTKYDLSTVSGTAASATLQLTRTAASFSAATDQIMVYALNDKDVGEGWGEYTITYNNAPGNVIASNTLDTTRYTYLGSFSYPSANAAGTVYSFSNAALQQAVNADTDNQLTLAFLKTTNAVSVANFASRENTTYAGATLVLTGVTTAPEPSTFIMLCAGLAGLLAYAWRKRR
jgi:hypothetical protein